MVVEVGNVRSVMGGRATGARDPGTCVSGRELSRAYDQTSRVVQSQLVKWQPGYRLEPGDTWSRRSALSAKCRHIKSS